MFRGYYHPDDVQHHYNSKKYNQIAEKYTAREYKRIVTKLQQQNKTYHVTDPKISLFDWLRVPGHKLHIVRMKILEKVADKLRKNNYTVKIWLECNSLFEIYDYYACMNVS